jgi:hypothetical protein
MFTESSIGVGKGEKGRELQVDPRLWEGDHVHVEDREIYSIPTVSRGGCSTTLERNEGDSRYHFVPAV